MNRRIFVAIGISEQLQKQILDWEKNYANLPVRWLQGKNLHITLIPPWYEDDLNSVVEKLQNIGGTGKFGVSFYKVSYGPELRQPRLVWAEGEVSKEMLSLKEKAENVLGKEGETRSFRLHLTLARFRPGDFSKFPIKQLDEKVIWYDEVKSFVLMESHLSKSGADYEVLKKFFFSQ